MTDIGTRLPDLARRITLTDMVAYAGATWDWHRMHYDQDYIREKHLPAPVVDGQVFGALLVEQLQDHFGPDAFVKELSFRFANLVFAGESVRCESVVSAHDGDRIELDCRVVAIAADGQERAAVAPASAVVQLATAGAHDS
ncbi:MAG: MaoC/PaaZ C-terminal domain-containing protein [Ornithinibacter sp.]